MENVELGEEAENSWCELCVWWKQMWGQCAVSSVGCQEEQAWAIAKKEKRCTLIPLCLWLLIQMLCRGFILFGGLGFFGNIDSKMVLPPEQDAASCWGNPAESIPF